MSQWDENRTSTPPMQSLAKENSKIKMDRAEIEQKPGGKTVMVTMQRLEEEKQDGRSIP